MSAAASLPKKFKPRPVVYTWDGDVMIPLQRFRRLCDAQFIVHEEYVLQIVENRSLVSHNHYFAALEKGWQNLAEEHAERFPSVEALRAWALVECGYATEVDYVCDTEADARRLAVAIRRASKLAVIRLKGNVVKLFEPESQSMAAMKKDRFEQSKADVLDLVASMARTTAGQLKKSAERDL